ncbi:MAG: hypothetical protein MR913_05195 [Clostridiales bacterium]|nr:hypothetical protein [Clostridiales bacterium]
MMEKKNIRFITSPYIFVLSTISLIAVTIITSCILIDIMHGILATCKTISAIFHHQDFVGIIMFGGLLVLCYVAFFVPAFQFFSICVIRENCLELRAPFHHSKRLDYSEIQYVGIDYGVLSLTKQFWIYFSKEPIPMKYYHNIVKMPLSNKMFRIQFSMKTYKLLLENTPLSISKQLEKGWSTIRHYHLDKET